MINVNRSIILAVYLATALCAAVDAAEPITNILTAQRVVTHADGSEHLQNASTANPGDVIQYTAAFRNPGANAVHGLEATLPIPIGVALLPASVQPRNVRVSIDGTHFAPMPLMRRVRLADGTFANEAIPAAEYRFVRWAPTELQANGELSVSARVVLANNSDRIAPH